MKKKDNKISTVVLLAGGKGTRFLEETVITPKPMINIGHTPIIQRIMQHYSNYGIRNFIICGGYKINVIKDYFLNFLNYSNDISLNYSNNSLQFLSSKFVDWKVNIIDTGNDSMTGGRLKRIRRFVKEENFCFTYGDGISNVDLNKLISFHFKQNKIATMTTVQPPGRYGAVSINKNLVSNFSEKPKGDNTYINGGFFVLNSKIFDFIKNDKSIFENDVLPILAKKKQLTAYKHDGFWHAMDSLRDKLYLEELFKKNQLNF